MSTGSIQARLQKISIAAGIALAASQALADATGFDKFVPLTGNTDAGTLPESAPFRLSSGDFRHVNIVTRDTQQLERFDSGNYDMHTVNENGPEAGRYLFCPFETGQAGIQRTDLRNMQTVTFGRLRIPTDADGNPLPGVVLVHDNEIDGRATPKLDPFLGTAFDRPEDLEIKTLRNKKQMLFVATTTNSKVFSIDLSRNEVKLFASRATTDMATGYPVDREFTSPDNLAIDADGNIYIVEDQPGGLEDTWYALDEDNDGVAEAIGKWASLNTLGAEATGLYFDPFNPHLAYINVQHPDSGEDRTIMLMAPSVPADQGRHLGQ